MNEQFPLLKLEIIKRRPMEGPKSLVFFDISFVSNPTDDNCLFNCVRVDGILIPIASEQEIEREMGLQWQ
jgi:hypothetical protein